VINTNLGFEGVQFVVNKKILCTA